MRRRHTPAAAFALALVACRPEAPPGQGTPPASLTDAAVQAEAPECPTAPVPAKELPGTLALDRLSETWIGQRSAAPNGSLQTGAEIEELNTRFSDVKGAWRDPGSRAVGNPEQVSAAIEDRLAYLEQQRALGFFVEGTAGSLHAARAVYVSSSAVDHQRLIIQETQLWCAPLSTGLYKVPVDRAFDRNACASLHPAERVRVLRRGAQGKWLYVHAGHTVGWIENAAVTSRLGPDDLDAWTTERRLMPLHDAVTTTTGFRIRLGVSVPIVSADDQAFRVLVPADRGLAEATVARSASVSDGALELTWPALVKVALSQLGQPYGWGGTGGARDCSRYLRDVFDPFGVQLGRHSGVQAKLGARSVDVATLSEADKRAEIDRWAERGAVLLYMPGHIMLYLGRRDEHQLAVSSISEYATPCAGGADTVHRIDRVAVGTLELGRGTERRSFIERITRLVVFGPGLVSHPSDAPAEAAEPSAGQG